MLAQSGVLQRLLSLLTEPNAEPTIRIDAAIIIGKRVERDDAFITDLFAKNTFSHSGSLAKGTEAHVRALIDGGVVHVLLDIVCCGGDIKSSNSRLVEVCLCALRSIFLHPIAPIDEIHSNLTSLQHIVSKLYLIRCVTLNVVHLQSSPHLF